MGGIIARIIMENIMHCYYCQYYLLLLPISLIITNLFCTMCIVKALFASILRDSTSLHSTAYNRRVDQKNDI